jgi:putative aminopeptidase FrvX
MERLTDGKITAKQLDNRTGVQMIRHLESYME